MMATERLHVVPTSDLVEHDVDEDCVCGPTPDPVFRDDGTNGWIFVHHALDGRDTGERKPYVENGKEEIANGEG